MWLEIDGRQCYAYTGGRTPAGRQPAVVFVHGAQQDHSIWILQSRYLAHHGYDVYAVDLPGHGRSGGPALPTIESMAQWLAAFIDSAGVPDAAIVGHSMGSLIALEFSGVAPERVDRLALLGATYPMKVSDALLSAARDDEAAAFDMINLWSHSGLNHRPGCPGPGFSIFVQDRRLMERQARGVLLNDFNACNAYANGERRADALRRPVRFILGSRDLMTPMRGARAFAQRIADAEVVTIDGAGHAMMAERPDEVLDALREFLASTRTSAQA